MDDQLKISPSAKRQFDAITRLYRSGSDPAALRRAIARVAKQNMKKIFFKGEPDEVFHLLEIALVGHCKKGEAPLVEYLMTAGFPPCCEFLKNSAPPLHQALKDGGNYTRVIRALVETGKVPLTDLAVAAWRANRLGWIKILLGDKKFTGQTLHASVILQHHAGLGNYKIAEYLIRHGWNINDVKEINCLLALARRYAAAMAGAKDLEPRKTLQTIKWMGQQGSRPALWSNPDMVAELSGLARKFPKLKKALKVD